jgi:hypothetical protein
VEWLYYLQFRNVLNCWFIELCYVRRLEEFVICESIWLYEEPIDGDDLVGVQIICAEFNLRRDFSKAFDRVRHQLLLEEMSVGIEPTRCLWLMSYLTGRIQRIRIGASTRIIVFYLVCQQNIGDF